MDKGDDKRQQARDSSTRDDGRESGRQFLSPESTNLDRAPSLHGLHAQSSTETSGLGETITSGFSSQESIHSLRGSTRSRGDTGGLSLSPEEAEARRREIRARETRAQREMKTDTNKHRTNSKMSEHYGGGGGHDNYDEYFRKSAAMATLSPMGLQQVNDEWDKRSSSRRSSMQSRSSHGGSVKSRSGSLRRNNFLGKNLGSQWAAWSRDRRASFRRRMELLDKAAEEKERTSTPVKKARQEGLKFVHPDLERKYLSEDDIKELRRHKQEKYHTYRVIEKRKSHKDPFKSEIQLSTYQQHVLNEFWDHEMFVRFRWLGVFVSMVTVLIMIVSITNSYWLDYSMTSSIANTSVHEGLWQNCTRVRNETEKGSYVCKRTNGRDWQNAVVGLMIFAATFGFVASMLSICGVCTTPLPRKIYYFHSAGEIFLVCALSTGVALIIFPVAVELDHTILSHRYGIGYGLGWGGAFFFFAAAICMTLDELVRESARTKCCKWCWKSNGSERTELRQV